MCNPCTRCGSSRQNEPTTPTSFPCGFRGQTIACTFSSLWGCALDLLNLFLTCDVHSIVIVSILTRLQEERIRAGEAVNVDDIFDSNCITPGTEFMAALSEHLRYFIRKKIKEDASWQKVKVIFSGHEVRCLTIPASIWRFLPAHDVLMRICPF
jgi:hypothetical protein